MFCVPVSASILFRTGNFLINNHHRLPIKISFVNLGNHRWWGLKLEVPPWSCSVVEHWLHVADFFSASFVKNFHTWDAVGGILNVERMRSSAFNVDVDWMSNWRCFILNLMFDYVDRRTRCLSRMHHGNNTLFWMPFTDTFEPKGFFFSN